MFLAYKAATASESEDKEGGGTGYAKIPHRFSHLTPAGEDLGIKPTSKSTTEASFLIRPGRLSGNKKSAFQITSVPNTEKGKRKIGRAEKRAKS